MTLEDYAAKIEDAKQIIPLSARKAALELVASEIHRCAWNYHARTAANRLAEEAQAAADTINADPLAGLDILAHSGRLRSRSF